MSIENNVSTTEVAKPKTVGFESKENILEEILHRLYLLDMNCIMLKNIPRNLSRISLKELIPEMKSCRFPECSKKHNIGYVIVQFQNPEIVSKYIDILNGKLIQGKKIEAKKFEFVKKNMNIDNFNLKKLYYNGFNSEVKVNDIKSIYPNAYISLPTDKNQKSKGMVTLTFQTEEEALSAFAENKMIIRGLKCELNYLIKKNIGLELLNQCKFSFDKPEDLVKEIISRFETQNKRTVMVKNLPNSFTLADLKKLVPNMRNCKICIDKKIGFIEFASSDLANSSVKDLNGSIIKGSKIRAFVTKNAVQITDLSTFNLKKLHLTNLSMDTVEEDIKTLFPNCEVELHLNTDGSCIGNGTLTFNSEKEALQCFSNNKISIKNVPIDINFYSEQNNKKRQFDKESDDDNEVNNAKKAKVETGKPLNKRTTNGKPEISISDEKTAPVTRKRSFIPKSLNNSDSVKSNANQKKNIVDKVEKKSLVPIKEKKQIKSVEQKKPVIKEKKVVETKQTKIAPGKRKFQEIEEEGNDFSVKKSRIVEKKNVEKKVIAKAKK